MHRTGCLEQHNDIGGVVVPAMQDKRLNCRLQLHSAVFAEDQCSDACFGPVPQRPGCLLIIKNRIVLSLAFILELEIKPVGKLTKWTIKIG